MPRVDGPTILLPGGCEQKDLVDDEFMQSFLTKKAAPTNCFMQESSQSKASISDSEKAFVKKKSKKDKLPEKRGDLFDLKNESDYSSDAGMGQKSESEEDELKKISPTHQEFKKPEPVRINPLRPNIEMVPTSSLKDLSSYIKNVGSKAGMQDSKVLTMTEDEIIESLTDNQRMALTKFFKDKRAD